MASRSFKLIVAALSLCEGCAVTVQTFYANRPRNKTVTMLVKKLDGASKKALDRWPGELTKREVTQIAESMQKAERAAFMGTGQTEDAIAYTSLALGLLDDLFRHITDPERVELLDGVHRALWNLHKYFDRRLNHHSIYERASRAIEIWQEQMAA
ncbi:MAG: hypothetical protein WAW37_05155 [Syntrophobacteraceae bacterium]